MFGIRAGALGQIVESDVRESGVLLCISVKEYELSCVQRRLETSPQRSVGRIHALLVADGAEVTYEWGACGNTEHSVGPEGSGRPSKVLRFGSCIDLEFRISKATLALESLRYLIPALIKQWEPGVQHAEIWKIGSSFDRP